MPRGDNIGNSFVGKIPPTVDVVEENLLGKITQDDDGGLIFEDINLDENIYFYSSDVSSFKNCSLQYGSGILFDNCKKLVINEEKTPFFFDGSINWTIPWSQLRLSCKKVEKNPLKKISYWGGYNLFFEGAEISGKVINDFSSNIGNGDYFYFLSSATLYNEDNSDDYTLYLNFDNNSTPANMTGCCGNTKQKNNKPFNIDFWRAKNYRPCLPLIPIKASNLFDSAMLGENVKVDSDEPTTLFHKKTDTIQKEEYPGIVWEGFEEDIYNADYMYYNVKTLQCDEFYKKNNNPLIHYLWPPNAETYKYMFFGSNISGSTIFTNKKGKEYYLRVLSNAEKQSGIVSINHCFGEATQLTDCCFDGNGENSICWEEFCRMNYPSVIKIGFRKFSKVYLQDTTLHEPSNSIHDVLIKRYDFGEKETEIYSDTFRYTGAENTLEYIKGKIYCNNKYGFVKANKIQNKITNYYIAPAKTPMMKNYDFNWDLSCFPNLSKESIEFTLSNILPSQLPLSGNAMISYNENVPIFKNKTLSTVYVKIIDASKDEKPIIFVENNTDGAITLQNYLTTYKPHLVVNLIDFSN